jgi:hypothetical protein
MLDFLDPTGMIHLVRKLVEIIPSYLKSIIAIGRHEDQFDG